MNKVLVIIVTYNAMKWIDRCLGSLEASITPVDAFIIDNGSTDGTQDYIQKNYNCVFVQSKENLGFGRANNEGFNYAINHHYNYVYLLNQDAWIFPNTISELIAVLEKKSDYGLLSPLQKAGDLKSLDRNFLSCCPHNVLSDALCDNLKQVYEVDHFMAAHWFMKLSVLEKVGLFSPSFLHYGEDNNWIDRLKYHGYKCGIVPSADAVHDREFREETSEKKLWIRYCAAISLMSAPTHNIYRELVSQSYHVLNFGFRYRLVKLGVKYAVQLLLDFKMILENKRKTLQVGAFL